MKKNFILVLLPLLLLAHVSLALAEDTLVAEPLPEQTEEAIVVKPLITEHKPTHDPITDTHKDYRYCLELKTNAEINGCVYKNR